jgi:hypothetical protein
VRTTPNVNHGIKNVARRGVYGSMERMTTVVNRYRQTEPTKKLITDILGE